MNAEREDIQDSNGRLLTRLFITTGLGHRTGHRPQRSQQ